MLVSCSDQVRFRVRVTTVGVGVKLTRVTRVTCVEVISVVWGRG